MARERTSLVIPLATTLLIHATFAAGLEAAELLVGKRRPPELQVAFELTPVPPPTPPPPEPEPEAKPEPAPPPPPPPKTPQPEPARPKKVASVAPPPAPGPPDESPAPERVYTLPGGGMEVAEGATGAATGRPGGTGKGRGGGGPVEATGTGPKPVPLASVKSMPEPIGEYDYNKDYPPEARKLGIEGQIAVRLLVDETGHVAETRLSRGLGHGLDEKALELVRRIRFRPARDDADRAVATWITWTVTFTLPR